MESEEARKYVLDYYGWTEETAEKEEYTVEILKDRVRELEQLFLTGERYMMQMRGQSQLEEGGILRVMMQRKPTA